MDINILKKLILEAYQNVKEDVGNQKNLLKQNTIKQLRMLRLFKSVVKEVGNNQQMKNMVEQMKKSDTATYIKQVLDVKPTITVKTEAVFTDPFALLGDIVDEIITQSTRNARQKLREQQVEQPNMQKLSSYISQQIESAPRIAPDKPEYAEGRVKGLQNTLQNLNQDQLSNWLLKQIKITSGKVEFSLKAKSDQYMKYRGELSAYKDINAQVNIMSENEELEEEKKEGDLPFLARDENDKLEKHKAKEKVRHGSPPPNLPNLK